MESTDLTSPVSARLTSEAIERVLAQAARRDWSRSQTIARAIDIGLATLESQISLPFTEEVAS